MAVHREVHGLITDEIIEVQKRAQLVRYPPDVERSHEMLIR